MKNNDPVGGRRKTNAAAGNPNRESYQMEYVLPYTLYDDHQNRRQNAFK